MQSYVINRKITYSNMMFDTDTKSILKHRSRLSYNLNLHNVKLKCRVYIFLPMFSYSTFDIYESLNVINLSAIFFYLSEITEEARIYDDRIYKNYVTKAKRESINGTPFLSFSFTLVRKVNVLKIIHTYVIRKCSSRYKLSTGHSN